MTFPTFVNVGTVASGGSGATISPGLPSGWAPDDIHVLWVATPDFDVASGPGAGWTQFPSTPVEYTTASFIQLSIWWRRAVSGDTAPSITADVSGNNIVAQIAGFNGCIATGLPYDGFVIGNEQSNQNQIYTSGDWDHVDAPFPALQTTVSDCLVCLFVAAMDDIATPMYSAVTNSTLANVTERADVGTTTGNGSHLFMATGEKATPGDTDEWQTTKALPFGGCCYLVVAFKATGGPPDGYWEVLLDEQ